MVECTSCRLRYLNPRPALDELDVIYPPTYHAYNIRPAAGRAEAPPLVTRLRHRLYSRRFRRPLRYLAERPVIDLLDVGCGDGWMLDLYRLAAPGRVRTFGVDLAPEACAVARAAGHTVYAGRFEELVFDRQFDLVNLSHVIEHVAEPRAFVEKIAAVLRPGGVLVVETPNTGTPEWRWLRGGAWGAYHIPRHWTFFDPGSIRRLGDAAGLTLRELAFHAGPVHWVWTCHNLCLARGGLVGALGRRLFEPLSVFRGGLRALLLLSLFSALDLSLLLVWGQTSNMMTVFQKER